MRTSTLRTHTSFALALLLTFSLLSAQLACSPPAREKLVKIAGYGQILEAQVEANFSLPEQLFDEHVINEETRDRLNNIFASARDNIKTFNIEMAVVLAEEKPNPAQLVSVVAALVENVRSLKQFNNPKFEKALNGIEISLRGIASFFALQANE